MRKAKKTLLAAACACALVVGSVAGTVAYLTSQDSVANTFTVGDVKITLDETNVDGKDAQGKDNKSEARDQANSYKLLPGHEYTKDPIVHVDGNSEDSYLFVNVANEITAIEAASEANGYQKVADQMAAKGWKAVDGQTGLYVYVGTAAGATAPLAVAAGSNVTVFEKIKVAGTATNTVLAAYEDKTITVTAYAVQEDGFEGKTAAEIWAAAFGA